jgi:uncharacterized protein YaiL (DUF2058 family)
MAKGNPLQEQLLKAGLVKKSKLAEVAREQHKARHGKGAPAPSEIQRDAERATRGRRSSAIAPWRPNARRRPARRNCMRRRARSLQDRKVPRSGEVEYRFTADGAIRTLLVNDDLKKKLSTGALVIARIDDRYELLPRVAADKVRERDAAMIVLDHGQANEPAAVATSEDDAYYAQFKVPDDLVW